MIHVVAIITANPGKRAAVLDLLRDNMPKVQAEKGCLEYAATVDAPNAGAFHAELGPDTFLCVEKWSSAEALAAHRAAPHMAAYATNTKPLVARRVIHVLTSV